MVDVRSTTWLSERVLITITTYRTIIIINVRHWVWNVYPPIK